MRTLANFALTIGAAALFAGCGGSQPPIGAARGIPQSRMLKATAQPLRSDDGRSWMDPGAMHSDLLYVTDGVAKVYVYTYPQGRHVGTLTGFTDPLGECVDSSGDVFIVSAEASYYYPGVVTEYAHDGTKPIQTLQVPASASGCAIDPISRDLAVVGGLYDYSGNFAAVATYYYDTRRREYAGGEASYTRDFFPFQMCSWDSQGNLYLSSGYSNSSEAYLVLYPQGNVGSSEQLKVNEPLYRYHAPVSVQWDGKNITVSSTPYHGPVKLYQLSISGSTATVVGTTTLKSKRNAYKTSQVWIQGKSVVDVDYSDHKGGIDRWAYPNATKAYGVVPNSLHGKLYGLVISKAS
jgi:hypothetical protein